MGTLFHKIAAITGGSSGIGLAITKKFEKESAKVAVLGRDPNKLEQVSKETKDALVFQGDVCKIADLDHFYQTIYKEFGKLDILVANAGIAQSRHLQEVDEQFFDDIVNTNYKGVYFSVQRALPFLNPGASIILISSAAAHIGWPNHSVYSSAKAAVSYLARSFSVDLISEGIRVNAISPGFVDTPIFDTVKATDPNRLGYIQDNLIPVKRFAKAEEIAEAALFLASPQSAYLVGADLVIDGGLSAVFRASQ